MEEIRWRKQATGSRATVRRGKKRRWVTVRVAAHPEGSRDLEQEQEEEEVAGGAGGGGGSVEAGGVGKRRGWLRVVVVA